MTLRTIQGFSQAGRVPPHDAEAEAAVLGSILLDETAISRISGSLTADDFYREGYAAIYRAALKLHRDGAAIDNVTLAAELEHMGVLARVGGRAELATLQASVPTAVNVEHYARIVRDHARKRELIRAGARLTELGYDDAIDVGELEEAWAGAQDELAERTATAPEPAEVARRAPLTRAFPLAALPAPLGELAVAASRAFGYPPEFVAVPGLSALAVALGGSHALQVATGWTARAILWTVIITPPGSGKSPAQDLVMEPLRELEAAWLTDHNLAMAEYEAEIETLERGQHRPPRPLRRRCLVGDTTVEALAQALAGNPGGGLAWESNEISTIIGGLDQYKSGRGADRGRLLELWDGKDWPLDRVVSGSCLIRRPLVSLVGGLQPERIEVLAGADGLGSRFLASHHPGAGMSLADLEHQISERTLDAWRRLVRRLLALAPAPDGEAVRVGLRREARTAWLRAQAEIARRYREEANTSLAQEVMAKGMQQLSRLTLVLHCALAPAEPGPLVEAETVERAEAILGCFLDQALMHEPRAVNLMVPLAQRDQYRAVEALVALAERSPDGCVSRRRAQQARVGGARTAKELGQLLELYQETYPGTVVTIKVASKPGPPETLIYAPGRQPGGPRHQPQEAAQPLTVDRCQGGKGQGEEPEPSSEELSADPSAHALGRQQSTINSSSTGPAPSPAGAAESPSGESAQPDALRQKVPSGGRPTGFPRRGSRVVVRYLPDAGGGSYRLHRADGQPLLVGLFASLEAAQAFARQRGWRPVATPSEESR